MVVCYVVGSADGIVELVDVVLADVSVAGTVVVGSDGYNCHQLDVPGK